MKVKDVMTTRVFTVREDAPFKEIVDLLVGQRISGVPVVDADGRLLGLVTEADLMSKEAFEDGHRSALAAVAGFISGSGKWSGKAEGLTAGQVMTGPAVAVAPGDDLRRTARRMLDLGVKRFPVVQEGRLVGIVSRQDLLRIFHRSDAEIADDLATRMANPLYAPDDHSVTAFVTDGVVTLKGRVTFSGEVPVMEGLARDVPGVVHVESRIRFDHLDGH